MSCVGMSVGRGDCLGVSCWSEMVRMLLFPSRSVGCVLVCCRGCGYSCVGVCPECFSVSRQVVRHVQLLVPHGSSGLSCVAAVFCGESVFVWIELFRFSCGRVGFSMS
jgi:hypothetical protein